MEVYRLCKEKEIKCIMGDKSFFNAGNFFSDDITLSTHKYDSNKRYFHFFRNYEDLFYLSVSKNSYICVYDIPNELLIENIGVGYYLDRVIMKHIESVTEYAIDSEQMEFDYLKRAYNVTSFIDYDDYYFGNYIDNLEKIYDANEKTFCKKK